MSVIDAYKAFDARQSGWIKVALKPSVALTEVEPSERPERGANLAHSTQGQRS